MVAAMSPTRTILLLLASLPALSMAGCSRPAIDPVSWWRDLEGGKIAEERPAPPKVDAPYPNLADVPARPPAPDAAARTAIVNGLVADRTNAQYAASLAPLPPPDPNRGQPAPQRPAPAPALPATDEAIGASLSAAAAPPRGTLGPPQPPLPQVPATPPRRAPTQPVVTADLPPPNLAAPSPSPAPAPSPSPAPAAAEAPATPPSPITPPKPSPAIPGVTPLGVATPAAPVATLPDLPAEPPPPPVLAGIPVITAPTPPPAAPPPPRPPAVPVAARAAGAPVLVPFQPGSAALPPQALAQLKMLSRQLNGQSVVVTGYGGASSADAATQAAAMPLALARARAIAGNLMGAGVPANVIRITAEAQGQGGSARVGN